MCVRGLSFSLALIATNFHWENEATVLSALPLTHEGGRRVLCKHDPMLTQIDISLASLKLTIYES